MFKRLRLALRTPYVPHPLPAWFGPAVSAILAGSAVVRGTDLLLGPAPQGPVTDGVQLLGIHFWGTIVLVSGLFLSFSLAVRRLLPLVFAHIFAAAIYLGYSVATLQGVLGAGHGWRFVTTLLTPALFHALRTWTLLDSLRDAGAEVAPLGPELSTGERRSARSSVPRGERASREGRPGVPPGAAQRPQ